MNQSVKTPVIVSYGRSAVGKAIKGSVAATHPVDFSAQILKGVIEKTEGLSTEMIDDLIVGCAMPYEKQSMNMARLIALRAGLPYSVPAQTINRYCSSGLQTIATAANAIMAGQADIIVAGGVEMMNKNSLNFDPAYYEEWLSQNEAGAYMSMGETAENVAGQYGISRTAMDEFAAESHRRAAEAAAKGLFQKEIIPCRLTDAEGNDITFEKDECIRQGTTTEKLSELKPVFRENGRVTAGNSSQLSDGAAFVVIMSEEKALELGCKPIAKFKGFTVSGVNPEIMGIGPISAIPKVMELTGLTLPQIDIIELNEAFAAQALACIQELHMDTSKVNPRGGAIALGHPLGATGAILTCKLLNQLEQTGGRYGLVTMCIGGGMGAAGVFEMI